MPAERRYVINMRDIPTDGDAKRIVMRGRRRGPWRVISCTEAPLQPGRLALTATPRKRLTDPSPMSRAPPWQPSAPTRWCRF